MKIEFPEGVDLPNFTDEEKPPGEFKIRSDDRLFGHLSIPWTCKNVGFGEMFIEIKDGKILIDTEAMGPENAKELLCILVDKAEIK